MNLAIQGIGLGSCRRSATTPAIHVVTTATEHNSVLRALSLAKEHGWLDYTIVPCEADGRVLTQRLEQAIRQETQWIIANHVSNVTGTVQDLNAISSIARKHRLHLMLDAAQSLGYLPIDVQNLGIDILAAPSHKGLGGVVGASVLYVNKSVQDQLMPLWAGGTGQASYRIDGPWGWAEQVEAGNINVAAIAALEAALQTRKETATVGITASEIANCESQRLETWSRQILDAIAPLENLQLVGLAESDIANRLPVFSLKLYERMGDVNTGAVNCHEWAMILEQMAGIECRAGFHCAGAIHEFLGSAEQGGTLRLSLGHTSTQENVDALCSTLPMLDALLTD